MTQEKKDEIYIRFKIPRELHKRLKMYAVENGTTMKETITSILKEYLQKD